jgi:hypothetical protein
MIVPLLPRGTPSLQLTGVVDALNVMFKGLTKRMVILESQPLESITVMV